MCPIYVPLQMRHIFIFTNCIVNSNWWIATSPKKIIFFFLGGGDHPEFLISPLCPHEWPIMPLSTVFFISTIPILCHHIQGVTNCRSKYITRSTVWEIFRCANFDVQGHVEMMRVNIQAGRSQQQRKCERWVMTVESHLRFTQQGTSLLLWGFSLGPSHWELDYVCVCVCVCLSSLRRWSSFLLVGFTDPYNHTYSESLWWKLFKNHKRTQMQRQRQWQRQRRRQRQRQSAYKNQHMFYFWNPVLIPNIMIDTSITSPWSSCSRQSPWLPCCYGHTISSTGPSVSTFWDFFPHKSRYDDTISCALCTLPVKRNRIFRQAQLFYNGSTKNILHDI